MKTLKFSQIICQKIPVAINTEKDQKDTEKDQKNTEKDTEKDRKTQKKTLVITITIHVSFRSFLVLFGPFRSFSVFIATHKMLNDIAPNASLIV